MGKYAWIVFVLLGLWHVIGSLAEKAAKKQQEQRLKGQGSPQQRSGLGRHPGTSPASTTLVDRAGELAARRKAQLDELRRRRASHQQPAAGSSPAILRPTLPAAQPPSVLQRTGPQVVSVSRAVRPPPQAPARPGPARIAPRPEAIPPARPKPGPGPKPPGQRPVSKTEHDRSLHALGRAKPARKQPQAVTGRHLTLPGLADEPIGPALLRRMVMYREILDTPVALRDQQIWERW